MRVKINMVLLMREEAIILTLMMKMNQKLLWSVVLW